MESIFIYHVHVSRWQCRARKVTSPGKLRWSLHYCTSTDTPKERNAELNLFLKQVKLVHRHVLPFGAIWTECRFWMAFPISALKKLQFVCLFNCRSITSRQFITWLFKPFPLIRFVSRLLNYSLSKYYSTYCTYFFPLRKMTSTLVSKTIKHLILHSLLSERQETEYSIRLPSSIQNGYSSAADFSSNVKETQQKNKSQFRK